ncbi:MAG: MBL fold metallo-hydrolase [Patescibacteria group bacterium]|nr:MBL fold metallo-hydrolase [Patescibacteria group bacterium]MDD5490174.1 MBL fold metallo-hydrolase [Patescibacteria group bacterium]
MANKFRKLFFLCFALILLSGTLGGLVLWDTGYFDHRLKVIFCDVGQGDGIIIRTPEKQTILIDGGPDNSIVYKLGKYLPFYDKDIETMILTHPHEDHFIGLIETLRRYKIKNIYFTPAVGDSPIYSIWLEELKKEGAEEHLVGEIFDIPLGDKLHLKLIPPPSGVLLDDLNDTSIVGQMSYGNDFFLFTGDMSAKTEEVLLKSGLNLETAVLKVGHHGSKYSSSLDFLKATDPEIAVISVGARNKFGHPSYRTLKNLEKSGAAIYRTDRDGDVVIYSDGERLTVGSQTFSQ